MICFSANRVVSWAETILGRRKFNKVFAIGFNKTGTSSLHKLFLSFGLTSFHGPEWRDSSNVTLLKKYDCFSDGIPSDLSRLDVRFPGSKFILQVRDLNTWILSRLGHIQRAKARGNFVSHELWDDTKHSVREWIFQRNRFHFFVMSYFSKRPDDFLLVNYIRDGNAQQKIARFLGFQGTARRPSENVNVARANSAHEDLLHAVAAELSIPDHELRFDLFQPSLLGCCFKNVFPVDTGDL